jgi:RimJ/RimL family protein N-acetyltransferase
MLKSEHLNLRALERDDLPRLHTFNNDLEVELAGGGDPPWPQSFARLVADYEKQVAGGGRDGMNFAIVADDVVIGICGLFGFEPTGRVCELGITIGDKDYWGKGYGREAVSLLLDYAFRLQNARRVYLRVHARNERALRAYLACGFVEEGRLRHHVWSNGDYDDLVFMGILVDEWLEKWV